MSDNREFGNRNRPVSAETDNKADETLNVRMRAEESRDLQADTPVPGNVRDDRSKRKENQKIDVLAHDVQGTVSSRNTGSNANDIAGVSDLDNGLQR